MQAVGGWMIEKVWMKWFLTYSLLNLTLPLITGPTVPWTHTRKHTRTHSHCHSITILIWSFQHVLFYQDIKIMNSVCKCQPFASRLDTRRSAHGQPAFNSYSSFNSLISRGLIVNQDADYFLFKSLICLSCPVVGSLFYLLICIPNRECSQIREKRKKKLIPPIHSPLSSQPPTLPSHLPFSHSDSYWNPSEPPLSLSLSPPPTPPLSFVFSLPLIAKLARTQWAGRERMSKWKR